MLRQNVLAAPIWSRTLNMYAYGPAVHLILLGALSALLFAGATFQAAVVPSGFISLFRGILICVSVDNYGDWKPSPVMTSWLEKRASPLRLLRVCDWQRAMLG